MKEQLPNITDANKENINSREEFFNLAKALSQNKEGFRFYGITPESHARLKIQDERYPGHTANR